MTTSKKSQKKNVKNQNKVTENVELTDKEIQDILDQAKLVKKDDKVKDEPLVKWHPVAKKPKNGNFFSRALKFLGF